jgi:hypothetical protein
MGNILDLLIFKITLPHSEILVVLKLNIWVSVILMLLSNLSKNVQFLLVMGIIWVDKHILIVWSNMIKLVYSDVFVLTLV